MILSCKAAASHQNSPYRGKTLGSKMEVPQGLLFLNKGRIDAHPFSLKEQKTNEQLFHHNN